MEQELLTIGQVAERLKIKIHQIEYLLNAGKIEPTASVGRYRVFDQSTIKQIGKLVK